MFCESEEDKKNLYNLERRVLEEEEKKDRQYTEEKRKILGLNVYMSFLC